MPKGTILCARLDRSLTRWYRLAMDPERSTEGRSVDTTATGGGGTSERPNSVLATPRGLTRSPGNWLICLVVSVVVLVWAAGALAQIIGHRGYTEPWPLHIIALCTVSYCLTGDFWNLRLLASLRHLISDGY